MMPRFWRRPRWMASSSERSRMVPVDLPETRLPWKESWVGCAPFAPEAL